MDWKIQQGGNGSYLGQHKNLLAFETNSRPSTEIYLGECM